MNSSAAWVAAIYFAMLAACGSSSHGNASSAPASASSGGTSSAPSESSATPASAAPASAGADSSAAPVASSAPSPSPANDVPDVPMHVRSQPDARGFFANIDIEVRADGGLFFRGQAIGRMTRGQLFTFDGQAVPLTGRLSLGTRARREHFDPRPDGSIRMDSGATVSIDAQGEVQLVRNGAATPAHVHIEGYRAESRHEAETLLLYGAMKADLASR